MQRRNFLKKTPIAALTPFAVSAGLGDSWDDYLGLLQEVQNSPTANRDYWKKIRSAYSIGDVADFNSAGLGRTTLKINESWRKALSDFNDPPSKKVNQYRRDRHQAKSDLAALTGVQENELAICRNATEALVNAIMGTPLERGDEVVLSIYDYPHVCNAWKQRRDREGVVLRWADPGPSPGDPGHLAMSYLNLISARTRAISITDLYNWNGCRVPTEEIISQLPDHVRYRIVDAAQSLGSVRDDWTSMGATHIGASLHKWIGAPVGTGLLYVRKDMIGETWPLLTSNKAGEKGISKFEHIGTFDTTLYSMISLAIAFHQSVGSDRKRERLYELADDIVGRVIEDTGWHVVSPRHPMVKSHLIVIHSGAKEPPLDTGSAFVHLWKQHKVHVTTSHWEEVNGLRVAPQIFTNDEDIHRLISALNDL